MRNICRWDGKAVDADCYTAESGSTIITLKAGYLETLAAGEHTLTVLYTDGEAIGTFTIAEKSAEPAKPAGPEKPADDTGVAQTGDAADIAPWIIMLVISVTGMTGAVIIRRKKG